MTGTVTATNLTQPVSPTDLGGSIGGVQMLFAKLQLALSQASKESAMGYMKNIQESQAEQGKISDMLNAMRKLKSEAASNNNNTPMTQDMKTYMDARGLAYDQSGNDLYHSKDQWDLAIKSMETYQERLGTDTQQKMVFVQDFIGQYNSYLQGANSSIQQSNQTLAEIARSR
jgi:hypothetical protein